MTTEEKLEIHTLLSKIAEILRHWDAHPLMYNRRMAADSLFNNLYEYYKKHELFKIDPKFKCD